MSHNDVRRMFTNKVFSKLENKIYARQDFTFNVTEDILIEMEKQNISKDDLAKKLSKSKSFVNQVLDGKRNMTLNTLSDICYVLNLSPRLKLDGS